MSDLTIDASILDRWQRCKRQFLLNHDYLPIKWRPRDLFLFCLHRGINAISAATDPALAAKDAHSTFLQTAANPGLDLPYGANPYQIAKDWCAMLETILRAASQLTLLALHQPVAISLTPSVAWQPLAWADDSGQLHRWVAVDHWGEADLYREMHGWHVFGDIAITECPLMLHVVEIGQMRNGRRSSSWARTWKHPAMPNRKTHFRRNDGSAFNNWKPVYLADDAYPDYDAWVEDMAREGETERLMKHLTINVPNEVTCRDTRAQILMEAMQMKRVLADRFGMTWRSHPMSRSACDGMVPCVFQPACHVEKIIPVEEIGMYQHRSEAKILAS